MSAAIALAMEQQNQKLLVETQLDITELDNLLQPIIDTCTKDAISVRQSAGGVAAACRNSVSLLPLFCFRLVRTGCSTTPRLRSTVS